MGSNFSVAKDISDIKNKHLKKNVGFKKKNVGFVKGPSQTASVQVKLGCYLTATVIVIKATIRFKILINAVPSFFLSFCFY